MYKQKDTNKQVTMEQSINKQTNKAQVNKVQINMWYENTNGQGQNKRYK